MNALPPGWKRSTLGELGVDAQPGFASGKHNNEGNGIVHLRPMNISREGNLELRDVRYVHDESSRRVTTGDVLFNNTNSPALVGKTALVAEGSFAYSNHMTRLKTPNGIRADFLARYLHWLWMKGYFKRVLNNHVNQASVATGQLLKTPVIYPSEDEQARIVANLEGHLSRLNIGFQSLDRIDSLRKDLISTTLLRATVEHVKVAEWNTIKIGDVARVSTGATPLRTRVDYYQDGTIPWVTSSLLNKPYIDAADTMITELALRETSVRLFPPGTLLIAMYGEGKTRGRCSELRISAATNQACAAIQLLPEYSDYREWIKLVLEASYQRTRSMAAGGVQPNLNLGLIRGIQVPLPPEPMRAQILSEVSKAKTSEARLEELVNHLRVQSSELRNGIFVNAFDGRSPERY